MSKKKPTTLKLEEHNNLILAAAPALKCDVRGDCLNHLPSHKDLEAHHSQDHNGHTIPNLSG